MIGKVVGAPDGMVTWSMLVVLRASSDSVLQMLFNNISKKAAWRTRQGAPASWGSWIVL